MSDYSPLGSPNLYADYYDEVIYEEDPEDLAGDLAAHALHSPVIAIEEEPGDELLDYHSDWEYYSDDYYDDDPALLRKNPIDRSPSRDKVEKKSQGKENRGRKRKVTTSSTFDDLEEYEKLLSKFMKGTVHAKPIPERDNLYLPGTDAKVALLPDWRERFGTTGIQDANKTKSRRNWLLRDESWANNLSLADMGLKNERGKSVDETRPAGGDEDEGDGGEFRGGGDGNESDCEEDVDGVEGLDKERRMGKTIAKPRGSRQAQDLSYDGAVDESPGPKKRRVTKTKSMLPSPSTSTESMATHEVEQALEIDELQAMSKLAEDQPQRSRGGPSVTKLPVQSVPEATTSQAHNEVSSTSTGRKRKASSPVLEQPAKSAGSGAARSTASSRAKRVASTTNNVATSDTKTSAGPSRSTRSKKK